MFLQIVIAFISIVSLVSLHELGHFLVAKKFGVRVEELGIGYPPRIFGKKIGETIYSINLIPFGAFVRLPGEIEESKDPRSFSQQSLGRRALITLGGVIAFWVIAVVLLSSLSFLGTPTVVGDEDSSFLIDPKVQIVDVSQDSPAQLAGLEVGDVIRKMSFGEELSSILTIREIQGFTNTHLEEKITLTIERGGEVLSIPLIPRANPPSGEGAMGVALVRTAIKKYPWYLAPWQGILATGNLTLNIVRGYITAIVNVFKRVPTGIQMVGPIGVSRMLAQAQQMGVNYFISFLSMIAIYLAVFNILPIPPFDGGKLLFLGIEAIRKKPVSVKIEQNITASLFVLLLILMVWVTINDIRAIF